MTTLGMPAVPASQQRSAGPVTFTAGHHFAVTGSASIEELAEAATVPLSVIIQIIKRCNFDCSLGSETLQLPNPTLAQLDTIRASLAGVSRVFLSGGEPLLRKDFAVARGGHHGADDGHRSNAGPGRSRLGPPEAARGRTGDPGRLCPDHRRPAARRTWVLLGHGQRTPGGQPAARPTPTRTSHLLVRPVGHTAGSVDAMVSVYTDRAIVRLEAHHDLAEVLGELLTGLGRITHPSSLWLPDPAAGPNP